MKSRFKEGMVDKTLGALFYSCKSTSYDNDVIIFDYGEWALREAKKFLENYASILNCDIPTPEELRDDFLKRVNAHLDGN